MFSNNAHADDAQTKATIIGQWKCGGSNSIYRFDPMGNFELPSKADPNSDDWANRASNLISGKYEIYGNQLTLRSMYLTTIIDPRDYAMVPDLIRSGYKQRPDGTFIMSTGLVDIFRIISLDQKNLTLQRTIGLSSKGIDRKVPENGLRSSDCRRT